MPATREQYTRFAWGQWYGGKERLIEMAWSGRPIHICFNSTSKLDICEFALQMWKKYIPNAKVSYLEYDAACATKHKTDIEAAAGGTLYIGTPSISRLSGHEKIIMAWHNCLWQYCCASLHWLCEQSGTFFWLLMQLPVVDHYDNFVSGRL